MFDFTPTLDALDTVPDNFKGLYVAKEGGGFQFHPEFQGHVKGLSTALDKERKTKNELAAAIAGWKALGDSPETIQAKLRELEEAVTAGKDGKVNFDKLKTDLEKAHLTALAGKDEVVTQMGATVEKYLINSQAVAAIADMKGVPELLLPHVRSQVKVLKENGEYVVRVVDKDGDARGDGKGGFMTIKDLVSEMRQDKVYGRAFEASGTSGSGTRADGQRKPGSEKAPVTAVDKIAAGLRAGKASRM